MKKEYFSPEFDLMRIKFEDMLANANLRHSDPQDDASGGDGHGDGDDIFD